MFKDECSYIDGGFYCNYPLHPCIEKYGDVEMILGIVKHITAGVETTLTPESTLLDLICKISFVLFNMAVEKQNQTYIKIPNEITLDHIEMSVETIKNCLTDEAMRCEWIETGVIACRERNL